ncbi:hypothetical protein H2508_01605 [Parahaliea sp. F7430]|uniref:Uncharacterized protein n=1 Tax=Sediminihaliea albiluteola TaxID=2758564 RepID=A0A7W2TTS9_9GAMM|nr:hypothetical protein [Sediminihaliea albiluteola]MBA6411803.1 hypothetical protein [Sediminihaliea albiluteola]
MSRLPFTFADIESDCVIETGHYRLDGRSLGMRIRVPEPLMQQAPYNSSAYDFLQQLRPQIFAYGLLEFPNLPLNPQNHTLAQRAPQQHAYSSNPYMTDFCQSPHQDTPPYPTAFWLDAPRQYFATWVMSERGLEKFYRQGQGLAASELEALHRELVPASLAEGWGLLLNQQPGLLLIDNSHHQSLYHARTCNFAAQDAQPDFCQDEAMYAFNEVGLLNYIDMLDSRRGTQHRDSDEVERVRQFMQRENLAG